MILSTRVQSYYNKLYENLSHYFWSFQIIENIAYLELSCYKAIPNISNIRKYLDKLKQDCRQELKEDKDLRRSYENICDYIEGCSDRDICMRLQISKEVIQ